MLCSSVQNRSSAEYRRSIPTSDVDCCGSQMDGVVDLTRGVVRWRCRVVVLSSRRVGVQMWNMTGSVYELVPAICNNRRTPAVTSSTAILLRGKVWTYLNFGERKVSVLVV